MTSNVKAELIEDAPKEVEDVPDFGGDEEPEPQKDEAPAEAKPGEVLAVPKKEEVDEKSKGELRSDAVHLSGVNRLTRTHLAEIFASKRLPSFQRVEWIADDKCICIFADAQAARSALDAAMDGFDEGREKPGPGLWRAIRGMMEFRQATVLDVPSANFKKQHRAGRQVRDYRFWEAAKDIDKNIMEGLEQKGVKRDAPTGEDAIAAAVYAEQMEAPKKKRRKMPKDAEGQEELPDEAPDLLQAMAQQDKELMGLKTEVAEEPMATGEAEAVAAVSEVVAQETWEDSWFGQLAKQAGRKKREEAWGRHAQADDLEPREDFDARDRGQGQRDVRDRRDSDRGEWRHDHFERRPPRGDWGYDRRDEGRKRRGDGSFQERTDRAQPPAGGAGVVWEADEAERAKRVKRMDRFSRAAPAAATDTAGDEANL